MPYVETLMYVRQGLTDPKLLSFGLSCRQFLCCQSTQVCQWKSQGTSTNDLHVRDIETDGEGFLPISIGMHVLNAQSHFTEKKKLKGKGKQNSYKEKLLGMFMYEEET